jgi:hypothetical protein
MQRYECASATLSERLEGATPAAALRVSLARAPEHELKRSVSKRRQRNNAEQLLVYAERV